jgi:exopolyphosphatase/guanosine-5'-triphosphate,3'-diphosphate pyrophosphatase
VRAERGRCHTEDVAKSDIKAAVDIGTNSMHLVVARIAEHGGFEILTTEKDMVRLGQGAGEMKELASDAIDRGVASLARLKEVAGSFGDVELVAVATSAVREATNKAEFIDRVSEEVGIEVEVITGFEEARLIHLGVLQALPVFERRLLVIDIGGGSTELCVAKRGKVIEARSMKLGAIRLTQRFFADTDAGDGSIGSAAVDECRRYVRSALAPVAHDLAGHQPEVTVGCSGTISTLADMALAARGDRPRQLNGATFTADEAHGLADELASLTTKQRRDTPGLDARRADIIVAGAILFDEILSSFGVDEVTISEYALREGVLFDRFGRAAGQELSDLRRTNLLRLAHQLDPDPAHAEHTAFLATALFDRTAGLHELGGDARELLDAAAIVHNVGLSISHSSHHKHTYYVVRHSEQLTGFTEHEIEVIAVIARYHRKSRPRNKHAEFAALSSDDQRLVEILAGMLRIAIGLDRRHAASVRSVRALTDDHTLIIEPIGHDSDNDLDLEIYAARERSELLAAALGVTVRINRPATPDPGTLSS